MKMICRKIIKYRVLIDDISSFSYVMLPALEQTVLCTNHMQSYSGVHSSCRSKCFDTISQTMHFINLRRYGGAAAWYYLWFQNMPIMCSTENPNPFGSINVFSKPDLHLLVDTSTYTVVSCSISSGWETFRGM